MKPSIVHRHVTGRDDNTYQNLMDATERHAVYQIRVDLKANKDPLGKSGRKFTSKVAALQRTVQELSAHIGHYPGNRTENDNDRGQGQYPDKTDSRFNKNQPGLVRQSYSDKKQKGLGDSHDLTNGTDSPISTARHFDRTPLTQRTVTAVGTVRHVDIRPRRLSTLTSNNKDTHLELDSHADT